MLECKNGEMVKCLICEKKTIFIAMYFTTTILEQKNSEGYFKITVLNSSRLAVGHTSESPSSIWDYTEWE